MLPLSATLCCHWASRIIVPWETNKFTGKIDKVTIDLKNTNALSEAAKKEIEKKGGKNALDID
jgi:hypothetical protein